jgi:hypothetical protein
VVKTKAFIRRMMQVVSAQNEACVDVLRGIVISGVAKHLKKIYWRRNMSENGYIGKPDGFRLFVEPKPRIPGTSGPKFEFKIDVSTISRGRRLVSVTRLSPINTKVKIIYEKGEKAVEDAARELKEKLSKGNI